MADYQSNFICHPEQKNAEDATSLRQLLSSFSCQLGDGGYVSGTPRIAFTQARDGGLTKKPIDNHDFFNAISIGDHCYIESTANPAFHNDCVKLTSIKRNNYSAGKITIGNHVQLQGIAIVCYEQVTIEDNVIFGPMVTIMDCSGHTLSDRCGDSEMENLKPSPVKIRSNAWIGANAMIMRGVEIGENAIIGAGSVVYQSVPANCIALGNPAKIVKNMNPALIKVAC